MKKINIVNNSKWKEVYVVMHSFSNSSKRMKLSFVNDNASFEVDTSKYDSFTLTNGKKNVSETIYLDGMNDSYVIKYNKKTKKNSIFIQNQGQNGNVEEIIMKDKDNLFYVKGKKKVTIYYPANFSKEKKYGVIISFDGQNAYYFNGYEKKNYHGGVSLDVFVENIKKYKNEDYIVVGIDNANIHRDEELTMSSDFGKYPKWLLENEDFTAFTKGKLEYLMNFINNSVLPYVKTKVKVDEARIGIVGASSGGLASYYAALMYPEIYSFAGCLSPALFFFELESYSKYIKKLIKSANLPKFYFYCGKGCNLEKDLFPMTVDLPNKMIKLGYPKDKIKIRITPKAIHNESHWRTAYDEALNYLI